MLQSLASPIPDQPLPPGAPAGLSEAMGQSETTPPPAVAASPAAPELSTPSPRLSTGAPIPPALLGRSERGPGEPERVPGRAHPMKPVTGQQIAEFASLWSDAAYSAAQLARRYRTSERTLQEWRKDFKLPPRPEALKLAAKANSIMGAAAGVVDAANEAARLTGMMAVAPMEGQIVGNPPVNSALGDPMLDPEIKTAMDDLRSEARIMSAHSDLTVLQRKLSRLAVLVVTKVPHHSWSSLQFTLESLSRAMLRARQVEASIPRGEVDPVQLRKEAAGQLMKELQSVMTPDEQQALAKLVKAGADRLMAKGGSSDSIVTAAGAGA
jgi:hypothetical protein